MTGGSFREAVRSGFAARKPTAEIARELGTTPNSVKVTASRLGISRKQYGSAIRPARRPKAQVPVEDAVLYSQETGEFHWNIKHRGKAIGSAAGHYESSGYRIIMYDGKRYRGHHVAWRIMTGQWPQGIIDHENGIKSDNRWDNLREATYSQNTANAAIPKNNTSGFKGVSWHKQSRTWRATIACNGRRYFIHGYRTREDAAEAYDMAARELFGEYARTNADILSAPPVGA